MRNVRGENRRRHLALLGVLLSAIPALILAGCGADPTPVPTPSQATASVISFITDDGVELRGRLYGHGQKGLVLAHMYPADQTSWWEFAPVLADKGYMTLTFDFRGYGDSGGNKEIKLIGRDLEAAIEFLKSEGASTLFLIGASMGGTAALKVAARQKVAGVVALSAPLEFRGISVKGEQVQGPVLLIATKGDGSATKSLRTMIDDGIVGEPSERVVYEEGSDHGTYILEGENGDPAKARILGFLEAQAP